MSPSDSSPGLEVLVFGGTTEGRELAEWVSAREDVRATVCCATEYGGALVSDLPHVRAAAGRLDEAGMVRLMGSRHFDLVVDCTHPYAVDVSRNARDAADESCLPYVRVVREGEPEGEWLRASDPAEAAATVAALSGPVLLTTGTKDLPVFMSLVPDARERIFARVLPVEASVDAARLAGLPDDHIVAQKGPFSQGQNEELLGALGIRVLVTKASGTAGGFWEKVAAARACDCALVVVGRPQREEGVGLDEACRVVERMARERIGRAVHVL